MDIWSAIKSGQNTYKLFIDGKWVTSSSKKTFDVRNPHDNSLVGRVQSATKSDASMAVEAAYRAKDVIAGMDAIERIEILEKIHSLVLKHQKDMINIIVKEAGKPFETARGEVNATAERLHLATEEAKYLEGAYIPGDLVQGTSRRFAIVSRKPLGVVLAITPFNYPLFISIAKIAPAIAAGNAVVSKAASDDPICLLMFARLAELAGMPKGALNVLTGSSGEIGDYLVTHPKVSMISFTGSSDAGKHIAGIAGMKRLHLELGGKGPALVLEDADLDLAVKECVSGALKFSGQRCDAISRILVVEKIADDFVKMVVNEAKKWNIGNPKEAGTKVGPMINENAIKKVEELVEDAKKKGAKLLLGGKRKGKGLYYEPTVLDGVTTEMRIAWEETFGPVATIVRVRDMEEAIRIANQSIFGLDASVFTRDVDKAVAIAKKLDDGSVTINGAPAHGVGIFPFGGDKDSGMGREGIGYSIDEMTKLHTIVFSRKA